MDSLAGEYRYGPVKRTSELPAHKQTISWTELTGENFEKIKMCYVGLVAKRKTQ